MVSQNRDAFFKDSQTCSSYSRSSSWVCLLRECGVFILHPLYKLFLLHLVSQHVHQVDCFSVWVSGALQCIGNPGIRLTAYINKQVTGGYFKISSMVGWKLCISVPLPKSRVRSTFSAWSPRISFTQSYSGKIVATI